jgi:uncharacterized repeat protein (TIGR02543 family)
MNELFFTVTFDPDNGSASTSQTVNDGRHANEPADPIRAYPNPITATTAGLYKHAYTFDGWFAPSSATPYDFSTPITGNLTLTARWTPPTAIATVPANNVAAAVTRVKLAGAANDGAYTLLLDSTTPIDTASQILNVANRQLTIVGTTGGMSAIQLSSSGSLFTVGAAGQTGIELTLGNNITLVGRTTTAALVTVSGGAFIMNSNSSVKDQTNTSTASTTNGAAGVRVNSGSFTMNDTSSVTGNESTGSSGTAGRGGGVLVLGGTFTMNITSFISNNIGGIGGGVYVDGGTFTMNNGEISDNTTFGTLSTGYGGGVYIGSGAFYMIDGTISGNTATNTQGSARGGGGVYVENTGIFIMSGGTISGNKALGTPNTNSGGGVFVYVAPQYSGSFSKTGGIIYGNDETDVSLRNTTNNGMGQGHSVFYIVNNNEIYYRDTNLMQGDNITTDSPLPVTSGATLNNWTRR